MTSDTFTLDFTDTPVIDSTDLTCKECDAPLYYSGKGRKPTMCAECKPPRGQSSKAAPRPGSRAAGDVKAALATMESIYGLITMGLVAVDPEEAVRFAAGVEKLQANNELLFTADKGLCTMITKASSASSKPAFFISNALALAPAVRAIAQRVYKPRPPREKNIPAEETAYPNREFFE